MFSTHTLFLLFFGYLLLFLTLVRLTSRARWLQRLAKRPTVYALSLCIYTSAWSIYASLGYAYQYGFSFLAFFLGVSGLFLVAGVFLKPLLELTRQHQLTSIADLFAFRYRSQLVGSLTTLLLLIATVPLLALQLKAMANTIVLLTDNHSYPLISFLLCVLLFTFTLFTGLHHLRGSRSGSGLVVAIAFESALKILALVAIALFGVFHVFHGPQGFSNWLASNPNIIENMYAPLETGTWHTLIVLFFVGVIAMPHIFHMVFTENTKPSNLVFASWGFPLLLLIIALCIPFILWAALTAGASTPVDYHLLGLGLATEPWVAFLGFIVGITSTTGILIVAVLALTSMCLNHLVVPFSRSPLDQVFKRQPWFSRLFTFIIFSLAWLFLIQEYDSRLMEMGSLSFVAILQFVPGLIGVLLWPGANRNGLIAGLITGLSIWLIVLAAPSLGLNTHNNTLWHLLHITNTDSLEQRYSVGTLSLVANSLVLVFISLVTRSRKEERQAAETCALNGSRHTQLLIPKAASVDEFRLALTPAMGPVSTHQEVNRALTELRLKPTETRPYALRRLRNQLETNLSGLLGPSAASDLINQQLPFRANPNIGHGDVQLMENRIEQYRNRLSGLALELDSLRRFHRQTLMELPIGVVSLSNDGEVIGWNHAMEQLSGVSSDNVQGANIRDLPSHWSTLFDRFIQQDTLHVVRQELVEETQIRWLNLHKSYINDLAGRQIESRLVIVVEDITEQSQLEARLIHSERLASIGRLAAGVAHEIGNPVTAISCLAQNLESTDRPDAEEVDQTLQQINAQTQRISSIVNSLITFSHGGQVVQFTDRAAVQLQQVATDAINLIRLDLDHHRQPINNNINPDDIVWGNAQQLQQVFINLLNNACDASQDEDAITLSSSRQDGTIFVNIDDQGHGINPVIMEHLFEPFITDKAPGKGTGLGLALIYSIMQEHAGGITATSPLQQQKGTRFTLSLPAIYEPCD